MKTLTQLCLLALISHLLMSCSTKQVVVKPDTPCKCDTLATKPVQIPPTPSAVVPPKSATSSAADYSTLKAVSWAALDGFNQDDLTKAWPAWLQSCSALVNRPQWKRVCEEAYKLKEPNTPSIAAYYNAYFLPYEANNTDGTNTGMVTGYYEPLLKGSRKQSANYPYPLYTTPTDLVTVELDSIYPELKFKRIRGRMVDTKVNSKMEDVRAVTKKLVPYYTRAEIETVPSPIQNHEFIYIDDIIDVFFLQIQGSGLVQLEDGLQVHVGYADQNGHAYNSIGRLLIERGELTLQNASMQGIKNWARNHLDKLRELLNSNPSYVFFRELPAGLPGPLGALGVPILAERVVAVDPKFIPLGAALFLATTEPNSETPLKRLMMAQDTGGAIKGGVRADFFWGSGPEAGVKAGAMKQVGKIWILLPKDFVIKPPAVSP